MFKGILTTAILATTGLWPVHSHADTARDFMDDLAIAFVAKEFCNDMDIDTDAVVRTMRSYGLEWADVFSDGTSLNKRVVSQIETITMRYQSRDDTFRVKYCSRAYDAYGDGGALLPGLLVRASSSLQPIQ